MYTITKRFEFEASHKLKLTYESPCSNIHGHSYKVEITVCSNKLNEDGMVMDFSELNQLKDWVMENWDHATIIQESMITDGMLKEFGKLFPFPLPNVTAEYMALYLHDIAKDMFDKSGDEIIITIYETTNNCASYSE